MDSVYAFIPSSPAQIMNRNWQGS